MVGTIIAKVCISPYLGQILGHIPDGKQLGNFTRSYNTTITAIGERLRVKEILLLTGVERGDVGVMSGNDIDDAMSAEIVGVVVLVSGACLMLIILYLSAKFEVLRKRRHSMQHRTPEIIQTWYIRELAAVAQPKNSSVLPIPKYSRTSRSSSTCSYGFNERDCLACINELADRPHDDNVSYGSADCIDERCILTAMPPENVYQTMTARAARRSLPSLATTANFFRSILRSNSLDLGSKKIKSSAAESLKVDFSSDAELLVSGLRRKSVHKI